MSIPDRLTPRRIRGILLLAAAAAISFEVGEAHPVQAASSALIWYHGIQTIGGVDNVGPLASVAPDGTSQTNYFHVPGDYVTMSPDRTRVAYLQANPSTGLSTVMVSSVDGTSTRSIATVSAVGWPVWSPDGTRLAMQTSRSATGGAIELMPLDGSAPRMFSTPGSDYVVPYDWSADGRFLTVTYSPGPLQQYDYYVVGLFDLGRGVVRQLTHECATNCPGGSAGRDYFPALSPDGREIIFEHQGLGSDGAFHTDVVSIRVNGSGWRRLVSDSSGSWGQGVFFEWSPDASRLAFIATQDGGRTYGLWTSNTDGSSPFFVAGAVYGSSRPVWSNPGSIRGR